MPFTINEERDEYGERTITRSISERQDEKKKTYNTDSYLRDQEELAKARQDAKDAQASDVELAEIPKGGFDYGSFETKKKKDSMSY